MGGIKWWQVMGGDGGSWLLVVADESDENRTRKFVNHQHRLNRSNKNARCSFCA
jgi:hypothetical protein